MVFFFFSSRPKKCYRPHLISAFILYHTLNSHGQSILYTLLFLKAFLPQCLFSHYLLYLDVTTCLEVNTHSKILPEKVTLWNPTFFFYNTILYHIIPCPNLLALSYNPPLFVPVNILLTLSAPVCVLPWSSPTRSLSPLAWKLPHIYLCIFILVVPWGKSQTNIFVE